MASKHTKSDPLIHLDTNPSYDYGAFKMVRPKVIRPNQAITVECEFLRSDRWKKYGDIELTGKSRFEFYKWMESTKQNI